MKRHTVLSSKPEQQFFVAKRNVSNRMPWCAVINQKVTYPHKRGVTNVGFILKLILTWETKYFILISAFMEM